MIQRTPDPEGFGVCSEVDVGRSGEETKSACDYVSICILVCVAAHF